LALSETSPAAVVVDVDFPNEPLGGVGIVAEARALSHFKVPVFFVAERDDITSRLEAVRAGGMGYYNKLVDIPLLLEKLKNSLMGRSVKTRGRVLIIDDTFAEAREIAGMLDSKGLSSQIVAQPLQVIQDIYRFQADLVLLNLELKEVSGAELARVLTQHTACEVLPIVLFASSSYLTRNLTKLDVEGASLLIKPVAADFLCWTVIQNLNRSKALRSKLNILRDQDSVSGLLSRRVFLTELERSVAALGVSNRSVAVIFIMLDNLRAIRDSTDVLIADELVEQAADRLRKVLDRRHVAARFGDAIFIVSMKDLPKEELFAAARALRDALESSTYEIGLHSLLLRVSIGISSAAAETHGFLSLIQQADLACTVARETTGERIHVHRDRSADQNQEELQRRRLLDEIGEAFEAERMRLMFQPILSLRGDHRERYEVLLRMCNQDDRELLPEAVFGVIQRHPLGIALDRWVVAQSIRLLAKQAVKSPASTLFVKVLPVTLQDESLQDWLEKLLKDAGLKAEQMIFEVTQTCAERDLRELFEFLGGTKRLGCGFCLDHFRFSADSFDLLKKLDANYVKLDMHFVQGLVNDEGKQQQLRALIEGLDAFGVPAIVSGIEDLQTLPMLWSYGINYVQGFFLQPPQEEMNYNFTSSSL
jgi:diguanylate cyclase (GGDEF)-like protein